MISLKENKTSLINLGNTIKAIENIDTLIEYYNKETVSCSYVDFTGLTGSGKISVQFDKKHVIDALNALRNDLVEYMAALGIIVD